LVTNAPSQRLPKAWDSRPVADVRFRPVRTAAPSFKFGILLF